MWPDVTLNMEIDRNMNMNMNYVSWQNTSPRIGLTNKGVYKEINDVNINYTLFV